MKDKWGFPMPITIDDDDADTVIMGLTLAHCLIEDSPKPADQELSKDLKRVIEKLITDRDGN